MPELDDLGDYLSPHLRLPVGGRTYEVPSPPALTGLRLQAAFAVTNAQQAGVDPKPRHVALLNDDDDDRSLEEKALGPVHQQMVDDGLNLETILHAGMTAYLWIVAGEQAARLWWVTPKGEALRPLRRMSLTSTNTGAASTTKRPASGTGTTSHPTSSAEKPQPDEPPQPAPPPG